jgi:hypothetical protein
MIKHSTVGTEYGMLITYASYIINIKTVCEYVAVMYVGLFYFRKLLTVRPQVSYIKQCLGKECDSALILAEIALP